MAENSKGFEILETLYKEHLNPSPKPFLKNNEDDESNEYAHRLDELGYIRHQEYSYPEKGHIEGFAASITASGIKHIEKIKETKIKNIQNWVIAIFTVVIAFSTFINIGLTALNIWLNNN